MEIEETGERDPIAHAIEHSKGLAEKTSGSALPGTSFTAARPSAFQGGEPRCECTRRHDKTGSGGKWPPRLSAALQTREQFQC